jgi:hypothetical protein
MGYKKLNTVIASRFSPIKYPVDNGYVLRGLWTHVSLSPFLKDQLPDIYKICDKTELFAFDNSDIAKLIGEFKKLELYKAIDEYGRIGYATDYIFGLQETPVFKLPIVNEKTGKPFTWVFQTNIYNHREQMYKNQYKPSSVKPNQDFLTQGPWDCKFPVFDSEGNWEIKSFKDYKRPGKITY